MSVCDLCWDFGVDRAAGESTFSIMGACATIVGCVSLSLLSVGAGTFPPRTVDPDQDDPRVALAREAFESRMRELESASVANPVWVPFAVELGDVRSLCNRLQLGETARAIANEHFLDYRDYTETLNAHLVDRRAQLEIPEVFVARGEFLPEEYFRPAVVFEQEKARATQDLLKALDNLYASVASLAVGNDLQEFARERERFLIDVLMRGPHSDGRGDLGCRISLVDVIEEACNERAEYSAFFRNSSEAGVLIEGYQRRLAELVWARANRLGYLRVLNLRADAGLPRAADQFERESRFLWNQYWELNETTLAALCNLLRAADLAELADDLAHAADAAQFPATFRRDAVDNMLDWVLSQNWNSEELKQAVSATVARYGDERAPVRAQLKSLSLAIHESTFRGHFAADADKRANLLEERAELARDQFERMKGVLETMRQFVPESDRFDFEQQMTRFINDDLRVISTY